MDIESIINKVLNNKATKEEIEMVEKWKAETESNLEALKEMQANFLAKSDLSSYQEFDSSTAWNKINETVGEQEINYTELQPRSMWRKFIPVAAAIVLLISATYFIFSNTSSEFNPQMIVLDDGSRIWLNTESEITNISDFSSSRYLEMQGEAYFEVEDNSNMPFKVKVKDFEVEVLGTKFNIKTGADIVQVFVDEGQVRINGLDKEIILKKGQLLTFYNTNPNPILSTNLNFEDWRDGQMVFKDFPLRDALLEIGSRYSVDIDFDLEESANCLITNTFSHETIDQVMEDIKLLFNIEYEIKGKNVDIVNINCN